MYSAIVFSMLVASSLAQTIYAPNFGYSFDNARTPGVASAYGVAPRTALDVLTPHHFYTQYYPFHYGFNPFAATTAFPVAPVAVNPAVKLAEAEAVDDEVEVVEADDTPLVPSGPVEIRRIFPFFQSDLRGAVTDVDFLRPDQVRPITPTEADHDVSIVVPDFRSFNPFFQPFAPFRTF